MIVDFRKKKILVDPLTINGAVTDTVDCFKFLGTTISNTRPGCQCRCEKAQQRLFFLRQLKKFGLRREILIQFYNSAVESVLSPCVCGMATWLGDKGKGWRESSELPAGSLAASWHLSTASGLWPEWKKSSRMFPTLPKNYSSFFLLAHITGVSRVGLTASRTVISPMWSVPCQLKTACDSIHPAAVHVIFFLI